MTTEIAIFLIFLALIAICFMAMAYVFGKQAFGFASTGAWIVIAGVGFTTSTGMGDLYFILGFFAIGMIIVSAFLAASIRDPITSTEEYNNLGLRAYANRRKNYRIKQGEFNAATKPRGEPTISARVGRQHKRKAARDRRRQEAEDYET